MLLFISPALAATTGSASNVTVRSVTLTGSTGEDEVGWFEYGFNESYMLFATDPVLVDDGDYMLNLSSSSLYSGKTYYWRFVGEKSGAGSTGTFTIPSAGTLDTTFDTDRDRYNRFIDADFDFAKMAPIGAEVYTGTWGIYIYGLIWAGIFGAFWLRQEDVTIPLWMYVILSFSIQSLTPGFPASWMLFIYASVIISIAGIVYTLIRGYRNG